MRSRIDVLLTDVANLKTDVAGVKADPTDIKVITTKIYNAAIATEGKITPPIFSHQSARSKSKRQSGASFDELKNRGSLALSFG